MELEEMKNSWKAQTDAVGALRAVNAQLLRMLEADRTQSALRRWGRVPTYELVAGIVAQLWLVRFATQHLGDLSLGAVFEVEQDQRPVHRIERGDEGVQTPEALLPLLMRSRLDSQRATGLPQRHRDPVPAPERDRHVQGDPVHPGGEAAGRVIPGVGPPQLRHHLRLEVGAIGVRARVRAGDLTEHPTMCLELLEKLSLAAWCHRPVGPSYPR